MVGRVVLIGAGGIGAPAALALAPALDGRELVVVDDDRIELSNLHRQVLFDDGDVGADKVDTFVRALRARFVGLRVRAHRGRALPETAGALVAGAALVLDATDNFATRFLLADACHLARVPLVHAAAVRWQATVMAVAAAGRPCYRCLFEDLPSGAVIDCATAGVAAPVCGVAGAVAADRALSLLAGDARAYGHVVTYDGLRDRLREVRVPARVACALCGERPTISSVEPSRYEGDYVC